MSHDQVCVHCVDLEIEHFSLSQYTSLPLNFHAITALLKQMVNRMILNMLHTYLRKSSECALDKRANQQPDKWRTWT